MITIDEIIGLRQKITKGKWAIREARSVKFSASGEASEGNPRFDIISYNPSIKKGWEQITHFHQANPQNPDLDEYDSPSEIFKNAQAISLLPDIIDTLIGEICRLKSEEMPYVIEEVIIPEEDMTFVRTRNLPRDPITHQELLEKYKV